jgi:hypothetical protein
MCMWIAFVKLMRWTDTLQAHLQQRISDRLAQCHFRYATKWPRLAQRFRPGVTKSSGVRANIIVSQVTTNIPSSLRELTRDAIMT